MPREKPIDLLREDIDPPRANVSAVLNAITEQLAALLRRGA